MRYNYSLVLKENLTAFIKYILRPYLSQEVEFSFPYNIGKRS